VYDLVFSWWLSIIKFPWTTSWVKWLKGEKTISKTISVLVLKGTDMVGDPVCYIYTCPGSVFMVAHYPVGTVGWDQVSALPGPAFCLDNMLVPGYQACLSVKPPSLLKFLVFRGGGIQTKLVQAEWTLDSIQQSPLDSEQPWTLSSGRYRYDRLDLQPYQCLEDKDRDGLWKGFFTFQPLDWACSLRELHYNVK